MQHLCKRAETKNTPQHIVSVYIASNAYSTPAKRRAKPPNKQPFRIVSSLSTQHPTHTVSLTKTKILRNVRPYQHISNTKKERLNITLAPPPRQTAQTSLVDKQVPSQDNKKRALLMQCSQSIKGWKMGVEPTTPGTTIRCSNH